jgi:DNA polymerase
MATIAVDDGDPMLWLPGDPVPPAIVACATEPGWELVTHHDAFERSVGEHVLAARHGWPLVPLERRRCTMAAARAMALPGALGAACEALGVTNGKDADAGRRLIPFFCMPVNRAAMKAKGARAVFRDPAAHLTQWYELIRYNKRDVVAGRELDRRVPKLSPFERAVWLADQRINDRGICIDRDLAAAARTVARAMVVELDAELQALTAGAVMGTTKLPSLKKWLAANGLVANKLDAGKIEALLEGDEDLAPEVRRALEIRAEAGKASPKKLDKLLSWSAVDGRARGTLRYCGAARTRRWSGAGPQPQNIRRPTILKTSEDLGPAIAAVGSGDLAVVKARYDDPIEVVADLLRSIIRAAPGKVLCGFDLTSIEARMLAALAGEAWKMKAFAAYDRDPKTNPDIYRSTASAILKKSISEITQDERGRIGKVCELAFGYGGAVGSFRAFARRTSFSDEDIQEFKRAWRAANSAIVALWGALERAAIAATSSPGTVATVRCGNAMCDVDITMVVVDEVLILTLPSGGLLHYPRPEVTYDAKVEREGFAFTEYGRDRASRMYGGRWAAHVTSASSRDLLAAALVRLDAAEAPMLPVVLHAHDEAIIEVAAGEVDTARPRFEALMAEAPDWARRLGVPIVGKGWHGERYRK